MMINKFEKTQIGSVIPRATLGAPLFVNGDKKLTQVNKVVYVKSTDDLPAPSEGYYPLEAGIHYIIANLLTISNGFLLPEDGAVAISSSNLLTNYIVYTGSNPLFYSPVDHDGLIIDNLFVVDGIGHNATVFDLTTSGAGALFITTTTFLGFDSIGSTLNVDELFIENVSFSKNNSGFLIENEDIEEIKNVLISGLRCDPVAGNTCACVGLKGFHDLISISGSVFSVATGQAAIKIDPAITIAGSADISGNPFTTNLGGEFFKSGDTGSITAFADSSTSPGVKTTVTSATHGLSNDDTLYISRTTNYDGGYTISNVTTNTFDIVKVYTVDDATGTWDTGSLDQTDKRLTVNNNGYQANSRATGNIFFQENSIETVIDQVEVPVRVNANYIDGYLERFVDGCCIEYTGLENRSLTAIVIVGFRPVTGVNILLGAYVAKTESETYEVTFDNTTNKVNRTAHGLSNDTSIRFSTTDTLPAEIRNDQFYWVVNATANDFQISRTKGGAAYAFTDNGTGTHYYSLGEYLDSSEANAAPSFNRLFSVTSLAGVEMTTGDKIEVFVDNHDSTSNIVAETLQLIIS